MNIFTPYDDKARSAKALDDKRLNKMLVETAQILSTALRVNDIQHPNLYKTTHEHHPCVVWASESRDNFMWLFDYFVELYRERRHRFAGRPTHKSFHTLVDILPTLAHGIPEGVKTLLPNCTPYPDRSRAFAYRLTLSDKWQMDKRVPKWTNRLKPNFDLP